MTPSPPDPARAFRALERRLLARRLHRMDRSLRAVVLGLVLAVSGFVFWQTRVPLDGLVHGAGPAAAAGRLATELAAFALLAAVLAAGRQAHLVARPPGPEWRALPLAPSLVARHFLNESRAVAVAALPPAAAAILAAAGLLPWTWLALLAVAFLVAWLEGTRLASALARRSAAPRGRAGSSPIARLLETGPRRPEARPAPPARAIRGSRRNAIARMDALLLGRRPSLAARLAVALALACVALAAWLAPAALEVRRALAFAAFLPACAALGTLAIAVVCAHPPEVVRPLPLAPADPWRARAGPLAALVLGLAALLALAPAGVPWPARAGVLVAWPVFGAAVVALGLHVGLTLAPRAGAAENVYAGWLGLAVVASLMIPLLGWAVLLAGLVHATLRVPRAWRSEPAA